jgi:hypothetical protein
MACACLARQRAVRTPWRAILQRGALIIGQIQLFNKKNGNISPLATKLIQLRSVEAGPSNGAFFVEIGLQLTKRQGQIGQYSFWPFSVSLVLILGQYDNQKVDFWLIIARFTGQTRGTCTPQHEPWQLRGAPP